MAASTGVPHVGQMRTSDRAHISPDNRDRQSTHRKLVPPCASGRGTYLIGGRGGGLYTLEDAKYNGAALVEARGYCQSSHASGHSL